ncbi:MAG: metallophosphoesterase [Bacteroidetes bacterium]|nr:metallophosphoesterase [Bacteroidota bacterium]
MRILALSDIHGKRERLANILSQTNSFDLVCIAGDFTTHGTISQVQDIFSIIAQYSKPIIAVAGNMDSREIDGWLSTMGVGVNKKSIMYDTIGFCGVSAAPYSMLHTPYEVSEDDIFAALESGWNEFNNATRKVVLSHVPPYKTKVDTIRLGLHVGSTALRAFIEQYSPDLVLCGHIHEAKGTDILGTTLICNCGSVAENKYAIIDINDGITVEHIG